MSDRGGSPHRPHHHPQLHPRHDQLLPWFSEPRAWTMYLISDIVWWFKNDGTGMDMLSHWCDKWYIRHGTCLIGVNHPRADNITSNYTSDMLSCYTGFVEPRAWTMYHIRGVVVQGWWYMYGYSILLFYQCYMRYGPCLIGVDPPTDHYMISNYTHACSAVALAFGTTQRQSWKLCTSSVG